MVVVNSLPLEILSASSLSFFHILVDRTEERRKRVCVRACVHTRVCVSVCVCMCVGATSTQRYSKKKYQRSTALNGTSPCSVSWETLRAPLSYLRILLMPKSLFAFVLKPFLSLVLYVFFMFTLLLLYFPTRT